MALSPEQEAFVNGSLDGHSHLIAGPGTGKSTTSVELMRRLANQSPAPRSHMITFTRAATRELQETFDGDDADLTVKPPATAHSFAMSVIMKVDPTRRIRMADKWETRQIIEEVIKMRLNAAGHSVDIKTVRDLTKEMAAGWESLDEDRLELIDKDPALALAFIGAWKEAQSRFGFFHVSEIPFLAGELLEDHPIDVGLDVLVVDEFQDLNRAEVKFIELLSNQMRIVAIGDDDQSIYGWRHANPQALLEFPAKYGVVSYSLSLCHRCGERILDPAVALISTAAGRAAKSPLISVATDPGTFAHLRFETDSEEYDGVVQMIRHRIASGVPPREIAVLARSSAEKFRPHLESRLAPHGIRLTNPNLVKEVLQENLEVRRLLALGRMLDDPEDSLAWFAWLKCTSGVGDVALAKLYALACERGETVEQVIGSLATTGFSEVAGAARARLQESVVLAREIVARWQAELAEVSLGAGGWGEWLLSHGDLAALTEDARRLFTDVGSFLLDSGDARLGDLINRIEPTAQDLESQARDAVRLMTMNSSKGLTVDSAFIIGVDNITVPSPRGDPNEELRILYVAMTRAKRFEVISYAVQKHDATAQIGRAHYGDRRRTTLFNGIPLIPAPSDGATFVAAMGP